jgi:hypothetical protein
MRVLVAILTCHRLDYYIDDNTQDYLLQRGLRTLDQPARVNAQRATWLTALPEGVDYKFFYGTRPRDIISKPNQGRPSPQPPLRDPLSDEVFLPCHDSYVANSAKMQGICEYALANEYDYVLRVDDDTFVYPERLFATDWQHEYVGGPNGAFAPGSCIFLGKSAMAILVNSRVTSFCDDLWVGSVMSDSRIERHVIPTRHEFGDNYLVKYAEAVRSTAAALHSVTPELMRQVWMLRTTSLSQQPKGTAGAVSKTTPSVSPNQASAEEKSSSSVILPTSPGILYVASGSNSSITSPLDTTPSSSDSESCVIGFQSTSPTSDTSSTVT